MITLKALVPTADTATAYQELRTIRHSVSKVVNERWTLSGYLDHTEAGIIDETWAWTLQCMGTGSAGQGTLSGLNTLFRKTGVTGGSANLMQLTWVDPTLNAAVTATAYFETMSDPQYLTPYEVMVDVFFRKYNGG